MGQEPSPAAAPAAAPAATPAAPVAQAGTVLVEAVGHGWAIWDEGGGHVISCDHAMSLCLCRARQP